MFSDQESLKRVLLRVDHPAVRILGGTLQKVTSAVALLMLKGGVYEWCGTPRRVRKMRMVNVPPPWVPCYRNTDAPTLQPSIEWLRTRNTGGYVAAVNTIRNTASI